MTSPDLTVVVCSLNGADGIGATFDALATQTVAGRIEVLVVDDGSTDDTAAVAARHGARVVRHAENRGLAAARNTGAAAASAELVAFTDDDCRPAPTWAETLLAARQRHPDADGLGGSVAGASTETFTLRYLARNNPLQPLEASLLEDDGFVHRLTQYLRRSAAPERPTGERAVSSVVGANMVFPRATLERHGGFDPRFGFGGEEEDLCRRVVQAGGTLMFVPLAVVEHDFEPGLADTLRRSRAYGRGNARLFRKHDALLPTVYPLPVAVGTLLAAAAARRSPGLALGAAALPCALFAHWLVDAVRAGDVELAAYPYVQLAQEALGNVGLAEGLVRPDDRTPEQHVNAHETEEVATG